MGASGDEDMGTDAGRDLSDGLRRLGGRGWAPPVGGDRAAVRTARLRSGVGAAGLVTAVAVIAIAVPTALSGEAAAPVPAAVSPTVVESPVPDGPPPSVARPTVVEAPPSVAPSEERSAEPVAPPTADPLVVPDPADGPASAGTLAGLRVRALEPGSALLDGAEDGVKTLGPSWAADPCGDALAAGDERRTGFYSAVVPGDAANAWQAATYAGEEDARAALAGLVAEVETCRRDMGTVWRVWAGSASDGAVTLASYDVDDGLYAEGAAPPQWGELFRLRLDGSTLLLSGRAGINIGTGIAYALGDTRPGVGPGDFGSSREDLEALVGDHLPDLAEDVRDHLAAAAPPAVGRGGGEDPAGRFPPEAEPAQGGRAWTVVVAVAREAGDPRLAQAQDDLGAVGYAGETADVACYQGAAEVLGLDPALSYLGVAVHFASAADAQQMVDAFAPGVVGTAETTTYCRD